MLVQLLATIVTTLSQYSVITYQKHTTWTTNMLKPNLFFWWCLMSKFPLHRPEATWCLLKPESISCSQAFFFLHTQPYASAAGSVELKPLSHSSQVSAIVWETGSHPGSWHKPFGRSQNGPKSHITKEFLHFLSLAVSTITEQHIYFSHQGICTI